MRHRRLKGWRVVFFCPGPKIIYAWLAFINIYTHCLSVIIGDMFVSNYQSYGCYLSHTRSIYIC